MSARAIALRTVSVGLCLLTFAAACTSSHTTAKTPSPSTTLDPMHTPNSIPYVVGALIGLPNGWRVRIVKVHRPYSPRNLPALASGKQYAAVDIMMDNEGSRTETVNAARLFAIGDSDGKVDPVVAESGRPNGIDGKYAPKTNRSGQLVFVVPTRAQLRMSMNGPLIGTQQSIFLIDPPKFSGDQS